MFHYYLNPNRIFCKQSVETLIRRRITRRLSWVCTVFLCLTERAPGLIWVKFERNGRTEYIKMTDYTVALTLVPI